MSSYRIVFYHMVSESSPPFYFKNKSITPAVFRKQIRRFKNKYRIVSLYEALNIVENGGSLENTLSITTDDGFAENYHTIAPILDDEGVNATFFLISDCIDNANLMWRNKLVCIHRELGASKTGKLAREFCAENSVPPPRAYENLLSWSRRTWDMNLKDTMADDLWQRAALIPLQDFLQEHRPYLTVSQIQELMSGGFDIGAHSNSHPYFKELTSSEAESEVIGSLDHLSGKLGKNIDLFAYPFEYRAAAEIEDRLIRSYPDKIKALLGIKPALANAANPYTWERDLQELPHLASAAFNMIPIIRRYVLQPLNIDL